ncbi:hypothetical protein HZI73_11695 [Vallitalea pronyensis]|uniref:Uncharacterized protein n=1 Tax=Vallitalea pronyensis TaxID=1348613 RepID=A0A8J8MJP9_9FIRM|nr:hypothetical protein [Vallitalea pronyensis]QUI22910.1 hypothetical protein HZI73_11695 [Vallitalea pronyensis]
MKHMNRIFMMLIALLLLSAIFTYYGLETNALKAEPKPYEKLLTQFFQDYTTKTEGKKLYVDHKDMNMTRKFELEAIHYGKFIDHEDEILVLLKELDVPHAAGFYSIYMGVFDGKTLLLKSPIQDVHADEGRFVFYEGSHGKQYMMFTGSVTYQGWTTYTSMLFEARTKAWHVSYQQDEQDWAGHRVEATSRGLLVFKNVLVGEDSSPEYDYTFQKELLWNPNTKTFDNKSIDP